jgi:DnaJ family protein C protein 7
VGKPKTPQKSFQQQQNEAIADAKNKDGCQDYLAKRFENAMKLYSEAITLCPTNAVYLSNRSACYMSMEHFHLASADALKAIEVDASYWKGYTRAVNCFLALGDIKLAEFYIHQYEKNVAGIESIKFNEIPKLKSLKQINEKIERFYGEKNFSECLKHLEGGLKIAKACIKYRDMKVECLVMLGRYGETDDIIKKALSDDPSDAFIIFMQGMKFYVTNKLEDSIAKFTEALKIDPDLKRAKDRRIAARKMTSLSAEGK